MSPETVLALNEINRRFYRTSAEAFSASRDYPWLGWERIVGGLPGPPRSVLDVGCGNARFGAYLAAWLGGEFSYLGLDASAELLALARQRSDLPRDTTLIERDLVAGPCAEALPGGRHSLVAAFGLLHHVPSFARRRELLCALAERLEPGGRLAISVWRFGAFERFRDKQVPFEPPIETGRPRARRRAPVVRRGTGGGALLPLPGRGGDRSPARRRGPPLPGSLQRRRPRGSS